MRKYCIIMLLAALLTGMLASPATAAEGNSPETTVLATDTKADTLFYALLRTEGVSVVIQKNKFTEGLSLETCKCVVTTPKTISSYGDLSRLAAFAQSGGIVIVVGDAREFATVDSDQLITSFGILVENKDSGEYGYNSFTDSAIDGAAVSYILDGMVFALDYRDSDKKRIKTYSAYRVIDAAKLTTVSGGGLIPGYALGFSKRYESGGEMIFIADLTAWYSGGTYGTNYSFTDLSVSGNPHLDAFHQQLAAWIALRLTGGSSGIDSVGGAYFAPDGNTVSVGQSAGNFAGSLLSVLKYGDDFYYADSAGDYVNLATSEALAEDVAALLASGSAVYTYIFAP